MSDNKFKQFWIYKGQAYEIRNDRSMLEDVRGGPEKWENKVVEYPALQACEAKLDAANAEILSLQSKLNERDQVRLWNENEALRAENKKFREALEHIGHNCMNDDICPTREQMQIKARTALSKPGDEIKSKGE